MWHLKRTQQFSPLYGNSWLSSSWEHFICLKSCKIGIRSFAAALSLVVTCAMLEGALPWAKWEDLSVRCDELRNCEVLVWASGIKGYWVPRMPALCGPPVGTDIFSTNDVPHRWGHGFLIGIFPIGGDTSSSLGRKWGLCTLLARKNAQSPGLDPSITHSDLRPMLKAHLGGVDSIFWCCKILLTWTN